VVKQLVLWDIDGTLLQTEGAGRDAMSEAGRDLQGRPFAMEAVTTSGRLDPEIWSDVARAHGLANAAGLEPQFRKAYHGRLKIRLAQGAPARPLPGARDLVEELEGRAHFVQGLLTGNYPETGQLKLRSAGLDPERFAVQAWGSDAGRRPDLVPVALERAAELFGVRPDPRDVIVIGDTPSDVACAAEHGCRSLAVGTGTFDVAELQHCSPNWVQPDLSDVTAILTWLESER